MSCCPLNAAPSVLQVDMVEIYNEDLRDLLAPLAGKQKKAQVLQIKVCFAAV